MNTPGLGGNPFPPRVSKYSSTYQKHWRLPGSLGVTGEQLCIRYSGWSTSVSMLRVNTLTRYVHYLVKHRPSTTGRLTADLPTIYRPCSSQWTRVFAPFAWTRIIPRQLPELLLLLLLSNREGQWERCICWTHWSLPGAALDRKPWTLPRCIIPSIKKSIFLFIGKLSLDAPNRKSIN